MSITVLLVDPNDLMRAGVRAALLRTGEFEIVGEAREIAEAKRLLGELKPDVLVLELNLPDGDGLTLIEACGEESTTTKVLALATQQAREVVDRALDAGCAGYLDKTVGIEEIAPAVRAVHGGRTVVSVSNVESLIGEMLAHPPASGGPPVSSVDPGELSDREREVLACLARGLTNQQAADKLYLSVKTVETYRSRLTRKLDLRDRSQLFDYALASGLLA